MKRPVLTVVVAVILAALAAAAIFVYTQGAEQRALNEQSATPVLVVNDTIPQGATLADAVAEGMAGEEFVPAGLQPEYAITEVTSENANLVAVEELAPGQMLLVGDFAAELPDSVRIAVPADKVAVSLALADPARVGDFLAPGSQIAVFVTSDPRGSDGEATTRLLLPRVDVIGVGRETESSGTVLPDDQPKDVLVTVAVDQGQAEKLIHAAQTGEPYLALLGSNTTLTQGTGVSDGTLFN